MKETPDYEKYPANDEEMCKRYKNWTNTLAAQWVVMYRIGKEFGGEKFVEKMKEAFFKTGQRASQMWLSATGTRHDGSLDCMTVARIQDFIDV